MVLVKYYLTLWSLAPKLRDCLGRGGGNIVGREQKGEVGMQADTGTGELLNKH